MTPQEKKDLYYFEKAHEVSKQSTFSRIHIGCIAVYKGAIIGTGVNSEKTHPVQEHYNKYRSFNLEKNPNVIPRVHAEIACLNEVKKFLIIRSKVRLYIYRERLDGKIGMCRPCPACIQAITEYGIRDIYYTTNYGYAHEHLDEYSPNSSVNNTQI